MSKKKIMVVEDEQFVAKHIRNQLTKAGYNVVGIFSTGEEAVQKVGNLDPDLVLMDIRLAGPMDGIQTATQIRARFNIPIVYLTAFADTETVQRSRATEPFGYLLKPFEPKLLLSTLEITLYKHEMEKKMRDSEARFRTLAESAPVGIFQTDIEGSFVYVNERWRQITGIDPGAALEKGWIDAIYSEDRERIAEAWNRMRRSGEKFAQEYRYKNLSGHIAWVQGHTEKLIGEGGELCGYIGTITDITDRKELEEKLLTKKKLESLGILAGGIAHDFNNLLAVIMGNISLAKEEFHAKDNLYKMLSSAEKASEEAARLAQKLITFSKGGWLIKKKTDLRDILKNTIMQKAEGSDLPIEITLPPDLFPVFGDETQLAQVFYNLLSNASDAIRDKKDGKINIEARNVHAELHNSLQLAPGDYICVSVKDNGVGIPKEDIPRVFDPYFTTKNMGPQRGMGLGLTICYSVVMKHDGIIRLDSQPGQGAIAEVYLPAFKEQTMEKTPAPEPLKRDKGFIFVVDDEQTVLEITRQMLERLGYRVATFIEGHAALESFEKLHASGDSIDLFLLDLINKKGLGGKETFRKLVESDSAAKVVLISGFLNNDDVADLKKEGFKDVLIKPFRMDDLQEIVNRHISAP